MKKVIGTLGAVALGAAAMYVFDPKNGRERREVLKEKAVALAHKEGEMLARAGRGLRDRAKTLKPKQAAVGAAIGAAGLGYVAKKLRNVPSPNDLR